MDELNDNKEVPPPLPVQAPARPSTQTGIVKAKREKEKKKNTAGSNLKTEDTSDDKANVRSEFGRLPSGLSTALPDIHKHKSKTDEHVRLESKLERNLNRLTLPDSKDKTKDDEPPSIEKQPAIYDNITLIIICKTHMQGGFCFIGLDTEQNRLLRPIFRTSTKTNPNACYWPLKDYNHIHVGSLVRFRVIYHPDQPDKSAFRTQNPHRTDDILVEKNVAVEGRTNVSPESLLPLSKQHIYEIFPQERFDVEDRFLNGYPECPSVGILLTNENSVTCYTKDGNPRVEINIQGLKFDFPNTAISFDHPGKTRNRNCIVVLGLGRPWSKNFDSPIGCYILVIGLILFEQKQVLDEISKNANKKEK